METIAGIVIIGEAGYQVPIEVVNSYEVSIEDVSVKVIKHPAGLTNFQVTPPHVDSLPSGETATFLVRFDVAENAERQDFAEIVFLVSSKNADFNEPQPRISVAILERHIANVVAYPLKPDAPDNFSMEEAAAHCALDISEVNEYDKIILFFTPKRDLNESNPEEFRFRVKNPNGKVVRQGEFIRPEPGDEECSACLTFTRPGSPGRFAVKLDLWDTQRLHKDPKKRFYMPGTYIVETIGLVRTAGAGLFAQGQAGRKEEGEWQEEGRFEVKDGNIHFAGFVAEPVNQLSMPSTPSRWGGEANIEKLEVDLEKGKVDLHVSASWQNTKRRSDGTQGPGDKLRKGRTELTMVFPKVISPGKVVQQYERTGNFLIPLEPMAEINIDWKADGSLSSGDGNACYVPVFLKPAPIIPPISRQIPSESWTGQTAMDQALDTPQAIMNKSWIPASNKKSVYRIGLCSRYEPVGSPSRTLPWHLHDPDTLWVFPVKFTLSPSSSTSDVEFYGYGVYRRTPGKYDGTPPDAPPWAKTDSRPAAEAGDKPDEEPRGEHADTLGEDPRERPAGEPRPGRDPEMPIDPNTLDPSDREVANYIGEWITAAKPPENAVEGNNVRYSGRGSIIGTVAGGIIESRHESGKIDPVFLWTNKRTLDSIDHCTMKEYVVARLKNESIAHCAGRFGAVRNLKGMKVAEAKSAVTSKGFTYALAPGSPAKTQELEGKVERQEPGPEQYLKKGQTVKLTIHAPYVPTGVALPDFTGKALGEARKWLEDNKLKVVFKPGTPAPAAALSGAVEKQDPATGTVVKKGSTVTLTIHSKYVDLRPVPEVTGLSLVDARQALERAGLVPIPSLLGAAPTGRQAGRIAAQRPGPGTQVASGSSVEIDIYGEYAPPRAGVPDVRGMTLAEAQHALRNAGFGLEPALLGAAPSAQQAQKVNAQSPAPGSTAAPGTAVRVDVWGEYASRPVYRPRIFRHDLTGSYREGEIKVTLENGRFIGRNYGSHLDTESYRRKGYRRGNIFFEVSTQPDIEETLRIRREPGLWLDTVAYPGKILTEINNRATYVNGYVYAHGSVRDDNRLIIQWGFIENGRFRVGGRNYHVSRSGKDAEVERIQ